MSSSVDPERLKVLAQRLLTASEEYSELVTTWPDVRSLEELAYELFPYSRVSIPAFQRALELDPNNATVAADLGFVYYMDNDLENAAWMVEKSLGTDPENVQGLLLRAALAPEGQERMAAYRRVLELDPDNDIARGNLVGSE